METNLLEKSDLMEINDNKLDFYNSNELNLLFNITIYMIIIHLLIRFLLSK